MDWTKLRKIHLPILHCLINVYNKRTNLILIVKSFRLMNIRTKEERVYELTYVLPYLFSLRVPLFRPIHKDFFVKSALLQVSRLLFCIFCLPLNGKSPGNRGKLAIPVELETLKMRVTLQLWLFIIIRGSFPLLIVFWTDLIPDVWALLYFQNWFFRYSKVICYAVSISSSKLTSLKLFW